MSDFLALAKRLHSACEKLGISPWRTGVKLYGTDWFLVAPDMAARAAGKDATAYVPQQLDLADHLLDLSHPLTAAGVLLLAREVWNDETLFVGFPSMKWTVELIVHNKRLSIYELVCYVHGDTEIEVLVAAIEARAALKKP